MKEQRKEPRVNKVLGAEIQGIPLRLYLINLSASGFRATCERPLPDGDDQQVSLQLDPPVVGRARLCWRQEMPASGMFDHGFEFLELGDADAERIRAFVANELGKRKPLPWQFGQ